MEELEIILEVENTGEQTIDILQEEIREIKPELEDLEVTPSGVEQNFKSKKYGYDNVKVKAVETEELSIIPSVEEQVNEGLFRKVTVAGDADLKPENIKEGTSIFGVEGSAKTTNVKITNCAFLFASNNRLDIIPDILALCENVTTMQNMFASSNKLTNANLGNFETTFDTSNVTNMQNLFQYCSTLQTLDLSNFNTEKVTTFYNAFYNCSGLQSLNVSNFDTSNVTTFYGMFYGCSGLQSLDLSNFDASKAIQVNNMFSNCFELTNLLFPKNLGKAYTETKTGNTYYKLDLSACTKLTHDSLMNVINNLYNLNLTYDVANGGTLYKQTLVLGKTNRLKLTSAEIAIATNKGWNVT